jgi:hypothetical protein
MFSITSIIGAYFLFFTYLLHCCCLELCFFSLLDIAIPCIQLISVVCSGKCYKPDSSSQFWLLRWPFLLCGQMNRSCCFPQSKKYVLPSPLFLISPCYSAFVLQLTQLAQVGILRKKTLLFKVLIINSILNLVKNILCSLICNTLIINNRFFKSAL